LKELVPSLVGRQGGVSLLMMSSGTFDGVNVKEFANNLLQQ